MHGCVGGSYSLGLGLLTCLLAPHDQIVDSLRHPVKVDKQAEEHLVCRRAVLVYSRKVAEDGDGGNILAVEGKNRVVQWGNRAPAGVSRLVGLLLVSHIALHGVMLQVVCGCDLGQQRRDHLDDVADRHSADLILHLLEGRVVEDAGSIARQ